MIFAWHWSEFDRRSVLMCKCNCKEGPRSKVAAFDLDWTLIKTISGEVFPVSNADWTFWGDMIVPVLRKLYEEGYLLVVFTNQLSLSQRSHIAPFKVKIDKIIGELQVPLNVFIATKYDMNRKPAAGMWTHFMNHVFPSGQELDYDGSFYVGDAAGRIDNWAPGRKKDFSMCDRLFARNVRLNFKTPEEYFLGQPEAPFVESNFHPFIFEETVHDNYDLPPSHQEVITVVGPPSSGKSHFVRSMIHPRGYVVINSCSPKTLLHDSLSNGSNVVLDYGDLRQVATRRMIISKCQEFGVSNRCFLMTTSALRCLHNRKYVKYTSSRPPRLRSGLADFEEPTLDEGFSSIVRIPFIPMFNSTEDELQYKQYLMDPK